MTPYVLLTSKMAVRAAAVTWGQMEEKTVLHTCLICLLCWESSDNKMSTITSTHSGSSCSVAAFQNIQHIHTLKSSTRLFILWLPKRKHNKLRTQNSFNFNWNKPIIKKFCRR